MVIKYEGIGNQYLGEVNGYNFILGDEERNITEQELKELEQNKWFNYLVKNGLIIIKKDKKTKNKKEESIEELNGNKS